MEVASSRPDQPTDTVDSQDFRTFYTRQIAFLVAGRPIPALLLRLLLHCAGDIEMNPAPFSTPTPTNCLRLLQWNANGISGKMIELLTFLHSNNVNIDAIQEKKLTNKTKPLITPGWAAVSLDRHKNKGGGLLMLIKYSIPYVDNTAALLQSAVPHLEKQGILITMPNRQQLHINNFYIPPRSSFSTGHNAWIAHHICNNKMSLIIPIIKPGMGNNIGKDWGPISLLCSAVKTLEKLLLPKILTHICFHHAQRGYRPKHSTCTALSMVSADIAASFTRKKLAHRTVLVALDLTAAFDNVDHQQLLDCVFIANIPATTRCCLCNYVQNRRAKVHFRQQESNSRHLKTGVVQGGVPSPALSNYYQVDYQTPSPNIKLIKYADDITIYTPGPVVAGLINGLYIYLSQVLNYISNNKSGSVNGQIYSNTFHARNSRAPLTSTSEVGRPSTTARKEVISAKSDARHPSHFHTTLQQYRSKNAATQ